MKIRVDFTIEISKENYDKLKELAGEVETLSEAHFFFKNEAEEYLVGYLSDNGIPSKVVRST